MYRRRILSNTLLYRIQKQINSDKFHLLWWHPGIIAMRTPLVLFDTIDYL